VQLVDFFKFMSLVVHLKKEAILTANINTLYMFLLNNRIGIIVGILEVQNCEYCVSSVVLENNWCTR
jgi:hypothetical protein